MVEVMVEGVLVVLGNANTSDSGGDYRGPLNNLLREPQASAINIGSDKIGNRCSASRLRSAINVEADARPCNVVFGAAPRTSNRYI